MSRVGELSPSSNFAVDEPEAWPQEAGPGAATAPRKAPELLRAPPAEPGPKRDSHQEIREALSRGFFGLGADTERVHQRLDSLAPAEYRRELTRMSQDGLLRRYLEGMDGQEQARFFAQAAEKGVLEDRTERPTAGALGPPAPPRRYLNDPHLPPELRRCVHEQNLAQARAYCGGYGEYLSRYEAAVGQVESGQELRRLGPPAPRADLSEPGMVASHPDHAELHREWLHAGEYPSEAGAQRAITDRLADLLGERRPGSFGLEGELRLRRAAAGGVCKRAVEERLSLELRPGAATAERSTAIVRKLGPASDERAVSAEGGVRRKVGLSTDGLGGAAVSDRGEVELKTRAFDGVRGTVSANAAEGDLSLGLEARRGEAGVELSVKAGLFAHGVRKEAAAHALDRENPGVFATPKELERGARWSELAAEARARHVRNGWTEQEWAEALAR